MSRRTRSRRIIDSSRMRRAIRRKSGENAPRMRRRKAIEAGAIALARRKMEKGGANFGLAEERTQARGRLFLGDFLLFLLLFLFLLFFLFGCGSGCRSGSRRGDGGFEGLVDVHAFQRGGQGLHAGLIDLHSGGGEHFLQVLFAHRLTGRMEDQRPVHIFHSCHLLLVHPPSIARSSSSDAFGTRAAKASIWECAFAKRKLMDSFVGNSDSTASRRACMWALSRSGPMVSFVGYALSTASASASRPAC